MTKSEQKLSFENALERVDEIAAVLSGGSASLEDSVRLYAEGSKLLVEAGRLLDEAQLEVEQISPDIFKGGETE